MLSAVTVTVTSLRATSALTLRRSLSLSAASWQQQQQPSDPIQELFVQKVREYADKKKRAGGKLVDADAKVQEGLNKELDKVRKRTICSA